MAIFLRVSKPTKSLWWSLFAKNSQILTFFAKKTPTVNVRLYSKNVSVPCKEKRNKLSDMNLIILYNFINCPVFIDIKQKLHYKVAIE